MTTLARLRERMALLLWVSKMARLPMLLLKVRKEK